MESVRGSPFFFPWPLQSRSQAVSVTPRGRGQAGLHRAGTVERRPVVSVVGGGGVGVWLIRKAPVFWVREFREEDFISIQHIQLLYTLINS